MPIHSTDVRRQAAHVCTVVCVYMLMQMTTLYDARGTRFCAIVMDNHRCNPAPRSGKPTQRRLTEMGRSLRQLECS